VRLVIASGKGGTGKTLVAISLALVAAERARGAERLPALLDADVEAPNVGLFLQAEARETVSVARPVPVVDAARCTHCGRCAEVCQFNAIAALPTQTLVFAELCHGCGSCTLQCPAGAISEAPQPMGRVTLGLGPGLRLGEGELQVGEAMATPVIRALKREAHRRGWHDEAVMIVDAPPGAACPVIEALRGADAALLVTEPTPFGLHDLRLAVEVARDVLGLPVGVAINRDDGGDATVEAYCSEEGLPVLLRLPLAREIAAAYSDGQPLVTALPGYRPTFEAALDALLALAGEVRP
jgi:MinD superfamily P-loop ATPase